MKSGNLLPIPCWLALAVMPLSCLGQSLPTFSGAGGAAGQISGGRGGIVYHVTKLDKNYSDNAAWHSPLRFE